MPDDLVAMVVVDRSEHMDTSHVLSFDDIEALDAYAEDMLAGRD